MTEVDVVALRAAAEKATPGPWVHEHDDYGDEWWFGGLSDGGQETLTFGSGYAHMVTDARHASDAAYIAAVSPDVLTALLDRLEKAESAVGRVRGVMADPHYGWWHTGGTKCVAAYAIDEALDGDA